MKLLSLMSTVVGKVRSNNVAASIPVLVIVIIVVRVINIEEIQMSSCPRSCSS